MNRLSTHKMKKHIKTIASIIAAAAAAAALACWYNKIVYDDYIASVNNYERHTEVQH